MTRKFSALVLVLMLFTVACGSMNRVTPAGMDATSMEADVRGKILAAGLPEKTFAVEVKADPSAGVVTISGHAASQSDIAKIVDAANSVSGVRRVVNNLHVE
jgi:osmotically-inducible protein OsmY